MAHAESDTHIAVALSLFGYPKLHSTDQPLHTKLPKKAVALLAYVAVADAPIGRETAETLLWPDAPTKTAKQSLRNLLSRLRKALPNIVTITARTIALQPGFAQRTDVALFQRGVAAIQRAQRNHEPLDLQQWQRALDQYRDDFLAGFHIQNAASFDEWTVVQREYLREQAITNLHSLSAAHAAAGDIDLALAALTRLLVIEPWHEAAYRQQIELLQTSGRRTEALQLYARYRQLLADEFDLEPSPEINALYQQIKIGTSVPLHAPRAPAQPQPATSTQTTVDHALVIEPIPNNLPHPLRIFFGREKELALIQRRITEPACRLLTIVGAGGMGKTALGEEVGLHLLKAHAAHFPDGIFFVSLSGIELGKNGTSAQELRADEPRQWGERSAAARQQEDGHDAIAVAIAKSIDCELSGQIPVLDQLQAYLRAKRLLLILDNFEHLLAGAGTLAALLTRAPELSMIVTSRFLLGIQGETVLTLDKLSLPPTSYRVHAHEQGLGATETLPTEDATPDLTNLLQKSEAVAMFVQRLAQYDPHFALNAQNIGAVAQICHLVEGLPLGIELAAGISPALGCQALATELTKSLDLLVLETPDLPATQRSLWAV
ncbi:MAG: AAA family ATPase, partial [Caldilineaceae bacterium]|nr:AAA family ATPase [Caldilineaceae bacterium]